MKITNQSLSLSVKYNIMNDMKKIVLMAFAIMNLAGCDLRKEKEVKNDLQKQELKGKVKSVVQKVYTGSEKFGEVEKDSVFCDIFSTDCNKSYYNEFGNKTIVEYDSHILLGKGVFTYDNQQFLIESKNFDREGKLFQKDVYKNNENGKPFEMNSYINDTLFHKVITKYDSKHNVIERCTYRENGNLEKEEKYKYNENGDLIEKIITNSDIGFEYIDGKLSKAPLSERYTYTYDDKGNQIEEQLISNKSNARGVYEYDSEGNKIKSTYFDDSGNMLFITIFSYTYDEHKNWIKQVKYKNNKVEYIIERIIEYYK